MPKTAPRKSVKKRPVKKAAPKRKAVGSASAAPRLIDARIKELDDWRGAMLAQVRGLVKEALPDVVEEWKWGIPVWSRDGIITTGEVYKAVVKLTFAKGAALKDPTGLFNSSLEGKVRRAIDLREGAAINAKALKALLRAAADLNASAARGGKTSAKKPAKKP